MLKPILEPAVISSETDLLAAAIHIDRYVMNAMDRLDEDFADIDSLAMQTFKQLSSSKHILNDKVSRGDDVPGADVTRNLEEITVYNELMEQKANTPVSRLRRLCACCDRSFAYYSAITETTTDDAVKLLAEKLSVSAHDRSKILKQALGKECGCDSLTGCVIQ